MSANHSDFRRSSKYCAQAAAPGDSVTLSGNVRHAPQTLTQVLSGKPGSTPEMMVLMVALQTVGKIMASKVPVQSFGLSLSKPSVFFSMKHYIFVIRYPDDDIKVWTDDDIKYGTYLDCKGRDRRSLWYGRGIREAER